MNQGNWVDIFFVTPDKGYCSIAFECLPKPLNPLLPRLLFCRLRHLIGHSNVRLVVFLSSVSDFLSCFRISINEDVKLYNEWINDPTPVCVCISIFCGKGFGDYHCSKASESQC